MSLLLLLAPSGARVEVGVAAVHVGLSSAEAIGGAVARPGAVGLSFGLSSAIGRVNESVAVNVTGLTLSVAGATVPVELEPCPPSATLAFAQMATATFAVADSASATVVQTSTASAELTRCPT